MKALVFAMCALAAFGGDKSGIRPRPSASDYPAQDQKDGVAVGASVLSPTQVKNLFSTDLKNYVVVELSVYPEPSKPVEVRPDDFGLRIGTTADIIRAAAPHAVAGVIQKKNAPAPSKASDITLYPTATIGYESGPSYDPVTGQPRRGGGWVTGAGVGVGVGGGQQGPPPPASTDRDREVMRQELEDKSLPSGTTAQPVAGYLFFPKPDSKQTAGGAYELDYYGVSGKLRVLFPAMDRTK